MASLAVLNLLILHDVLDFNFRLLATLLPVLLWLATLALWGLRSLVLFFSAALTDALLCGDPLAAKALQVTYPAPPTPRAASDPITAVKIIFRDLLADFLLVAIHPPAFCLNHRFFNSTSTLLEKLTISNSRRQFLPSTQPLSKRWANGPRCNLGDATSIFN